MKVKVLKLGSSAHEVEANPGSTVQEVLDKAGCWFRKFWPVGFRKFWPVRKSGVGDGDAHCAVPVLAC